MLIVKIVILLAVLGVAGGYGYAKREDLRKFFGEVNFEMHKVAWPPAEEVINSTILIFIVTIALGLVCLAADSVFSTILRLVYKA